MLGPAAQRQRVHSARRQPVALSVFFDIFFILFFIFSPNDSDSQLRFRILLTFNPLVSKKPSPALPLMAGQTTREIV